MMTLIMNVMIKTIRNYRVLSVPCLTLHFIFSWNLEDGANEIQSTRGTRDTSLNDCYRQRQLGPFIPYQLQIMMTVSLRLQYLRYIVVKLAGLSNFIFSNAMCLQQQMLHIERTFQGWRSPEATSDPPAYSLTAQSRTMDGTTLCIAALSTLRSCPMHVCMFTGIHGIYKTQFLHLSI